MLPGDNYYAVLGVHKTAHKIEITAAYRKLAKKWHPDKNKHAQAAENFIQIDRCYKTLADPSLRAAYDATLERPTSFSSTHAQFHRTTRRYYSEPSPETEIKEECPCPTSEQMTVYFNKFLLLLKNGMKSDVGKWFAFGIFFSGMAEILFSHPTEEYERMERQSILKSFNHTTEIQPNAYYISSEGIRTNISLIETYASSLCPTILTSSYRDLYSYPHGFKGPYIFFKDPFHQHSFGFLLSGLTMLGAQLAHSIGRNEQVSLSAYLLSHQKSILSILGLMLVALIVDSQSNCLGILNHLNNWIAGPHFQARLCNAAFSEMQLINGKEYVFKHEQTVDFIKSPSMLGRVTAAAMTLFTPVMMMVRRCRRGQREYEAENRHFNARV